MRVPEDFALVAFDGSTESEFTIPALTTVNVPIEQMARDAVAQVLNQGATGDVRYPTELLIRRSCGCTP